MTELRKSHARTVWTLDGGMVAVRDVDGAVETFEVPEWAASAIYERGRRHDSTEGYNRGFAAGMNAELRVKQKVRELRHRRWYWRLWKAVTA